MTGRHHRLLCIQSNGDVLYRHNTAAAAAAARLWNLDMNLLQVGPPLQHEDQVICPAISVDGKLLATGFRDGNHVYV